MRFFLLLLFCGFYSLAHGQVPPLERSVNLSADNQPASQVLNRVGEMAKVNFSYNPAAIGADQKVTFAAANRSVRAVLNLMFRGTVQYKVSGEYIILTPANVQAAGGQARRGGDFVLTGYVIDEATGERIPRASIYDRASLASAVSDAYGFYKIRLPADQGDINLSVSKQAYLRQQVTIQPGQAEGYAEVRIRPIPLEQVKQARIRLDSLAPVVPPIESEGLARFFLPKEQQIHTENLVERIGRTAQISLLPAVGTNRLLGGSTTNQISVNLLAGYANEVKGAEVGGLVNIVRQDVRYFQAAGLFNLVGGRTEGVQFAGLGNLNGRGVDGWQAAGLFNLSRSRMDGVQMAGLFNFNWARTGPWQAAGLFNFSKDTVQGWQTAGLFNLAWKRAEGWQAAGLFNIAGSLTGVQTAALLNIAGPVRYGGQVGLVNFATKVRGGAQIGLVNYADSVSNGGVQLGLFSFVRRGGYKRLEVATNDVVRANVNVRTGVKWFYNIFTYGTNIADTSRVNLIGYGFGSGVYLDRKQTMMVNLEATGHWALTPRATLTDLNSQLFRVALMLEYKLGRHLSIAAGPVYNWAFLERGRASSMVLVVPTGGLMSEAGPHDLKRWVGFQAGVRIF
jgi:hypothetical protein